MAYRLVLDEHVEHEVFHRLETYGHDVEHVDFVSKLGKTTADHPIAQYSLDTDRVIVTYDDDFVLDVDEGTYRAVLYFDDATLSVEQVADIIHAVSRTYPLAELQGLEYVGEEWLWVMALSLRTVKSVAGVEEYCPRIPHPPARLARCMQHGSVRVAIGLSESPS